ncbi:MAG: hypothetical protein U0174_17230 [Polyangiaceae bacterium]
MFARIFTVSFNAYREAVRARVLHGLLGLALATTAYSVILGALSLNNDMRVVADIGAASTSLYAILVSVVLGATSLHREVELKTIFPVLTRKLRRHEYVIGKFFGMVITLAVFIALDGAAVLGVLARLGGQSLTLLIGVLVAFAAALAALLIRAKYARTFVIIPWSFALLLAMALLAAPAAGERRLVLASLALTLGEVAIVSAVGLLFSSFSSPFLTATFTLAVFIMGRSADTLAHLPQRLLSATIRDAGAIIAQVVPNLQLYVPPRPLLLGEIASTPVWAYVARTDMLGLFYVVVLLAISCFVFRKRDFT